MNGHNSGFFAAVAKLRFCRLSILLILGGCMTASPWKFESISTGIESFDSARLTYSSNDSPLHFEIVRLDGGVEAFLNLAKYRFSTSDEVKIELSISGVTVEETVPLLEGKMRLRFPPEITVRLLNALQEGEEVAIIVDSFEQRLYPEHFKEAIAKLAGSKTIFRNPFKGLSDP